MTTAPSDSPERQAYYDRIDVHHLAPLWVDFAKLVTPMPASACQPHIWKYAQIRDVLLESGELITAREAERRVLVLENPGLRGQSRITTALYAGIQLVLPGEVAPAHRHTQSALRFILEGSGAHTAVEGEKTFMQEGDFVITPSWAWHDHGNESDTPMMWLDGLDIPIVQMLDASFAERYTSEEQAISRPSGDSIARFGAGLLPVDHENSGLSSPIFNYPYARTREALEKMRQAQEWDPCHGLKLRYANPLDGGHAMPTIGTFVQLLPAGFETTRYRCTDATVYAVMEGSGRSTIGDQSFDWQKRDVFVAPSWAPVSHAPAGDAILFSFSDRPIQEKLGLWRESREG